MHYHVADKDYDDWLKRAAEHPNATSPLPHAIDWETVWAEWEARVKPERSRKRGSAGAARCWRFFDGLCGNDSDDD